MSNRKRWGTRGTPSPSPRGCSRCSTGLNPPVAPALLFGGFLLLHGHQRREVRLVVGQHQGRAVAFVGRDFQGQINPPEGNGGEGWNESRAVR